MAKLFKISAYAALLAFPVMVLLTRVGLIDFRAAFSVISASAVLAVAVFFIGMLVSFLKRNSDSALARAARFSALLCIIPIAFYANQFIKARSLPMIHNISTDIMNPPEFKAIAAIRGSDSNPTYLDPQKVGQHQINAYPEVKSLYVDASFSDVFDTSLAIAKSSGWEVVAQDIESGHIEATATTTLWGFKDDVAIRITNMGAQRKIDVRSTSRVGKSDLGANAKRIIGFLGEIDSRLD